MLAPSEVIPTNFRRGFIGMNVQQPNESPARRFYFLRYCPGDSMGYEIKMKFNYPILLYSLKIGLSKVKEIYNLHRRPFPDESPAGDSSEGISINPTSPLR
jgi:hypothetical protein